MGAAGMARAQGWRLCGWCKRRHDNLTAPTQEGNMQASSALAVLSRLPFLCMAVMNSCTAKLRPAVQMGRACTGDGPRALCQQGVLRSRIPIQLEV